jgi:hypothetical protein
MLPRIVAIRSVFEEDHMLNALSKLRKGLPRDHRAGVGALAENHLNLDAEDTLGVMR